MIRTRILFPAKENYIGESTANGRPHRIQRNIGDCFCKWGKRRWADNCVTW